MPPTTYDLTYRASSKVMTWTILAGILTVAIGLWTTNYFKDLYPWYWYRFKAYYDSVIVFGTLFLTFYTTRTTCRLLLEDAGFTVNNLRKFNLLLKGEQHFPWSDFSYQAGGLISVN